MRDAKRLLWILKVISKRQVPGKKALQKMVYLIERKGIQLGYDYSIHYYGPYSSSVDNSIYGLQMQGAIQISQDGMTQRLVTTEIGDHLLNEVEEELFNADEQRVIAEIMDNFGDKNARQLELITTTDFVAKNLSRREEKLEEAIISGVIRIKGNKFSRKEIKDALEQLKEKKFLI